VSYARFPPGGNLLVPLSSPAACRAGISMWSACRPAARALRTVTYHAVGLIGTMPLRLLSREEWRPPVDAATWNDLTDIWSGWFGPFDEMSLYRPRQAERAGFAGLLLNESTGVGFVKCRPDWDFQPEAAVISLASGARSYQTPSLVGVTTRSGWATMGLSPIVGGLHRARLPSPPTSVAKETADLLSKLHPPISEKSHWVPMHGDMGPWNLRHHDDVGYILFDWENSRLGPPGADLVFHTVACRAMGIRGAGDVDGFDEAAAFWLAEIPRRFGRASTDQRLAAQMVDELNRLS